MMPPDLNARLRLGFALAIANFIALCADAAGVSPYSGGEFWYVDNLIRVPFFLFDIWLIYTGLIALERARQENT